MSANFFAVSHASLEDEFCINGLTIRTWLIWIWRL